MATSVVKNLRADRVSRLSLRGVCRVAPTASIREVINQMVKEKTGCALVMRGGDLVGIFTERDFASRVVAAGMDVAKSVEGVMTPKPVTTDREASVLSAIEKMESGGYRHLPVLDEQGQPVGILSIKDIVHYLVEYFPANVYNLPPSPDVIQPAREGA